jgi:hypothetical protein
MINMPPRKARHKLLLSDSSVKRWYNNLARGSIITAENRLRTLGLVCETWGKNPINLLAEAKVDREKFENDLSDFIDSLFAKGERADNVSNKLKAIKSWLEFNGVRVQRRIKTGSSEPPQERVPSRDELARLLRFCTPRERVAAVLIAFSGLRLESLGNYVGTDGLTLEDFPELTVKDGTVEAERLPMKVCVRKALSKGRNTYFSFLPAEGFSYLKEYLELRIQKGEEIKLDSPVISHEKPGIHKFLRTTKIGFAIKTCIKKAGFHWRPYILRAYCATIFDIAESRGLISHPWRQFFMGHKGDIEARYSTNKGMPPPNMVEEMRASYRKCESLLQTMKRSGEEDPELTALRTMVESGVLDLSKPNVRSYLIQKLGIEDMEVKVAKMRKEGLSEEEAHVRILCGELSVEPMKIEISKPKDSSDPKKIVDEDELEGYLDDGWNVQTVLPSGKIIIWKTS